MNDAPDTGPTRPHDDKIHSKADDDAWMRRFQAGDGDAFDVLFVRHAKRLYLTLFALLGRDDQAMELAAQTWRWVQRRRDTYSGKPTFRSWLLAQAMRLRREQARSQSVTASQPGEPRPVTDGASLLCALHDLPDSYREALVLHRYAELSFAEIAEVLGASEEAVQKRAQQGESLLVQAVGSLPDGALLPVEATALDRMARAVLPNRDSPKHPFRALSLLLSCVVLGLGLALLLVRLHR